MKHAFTLVLSLLILIVMYEGWKIGMTFYAPTTDRSLVVLTPVVKAGEKLVVAATFTRQRACKSTANMVIVDAAMKNPAILREQTVGTPATLGTFTVKVPLQIKSDAPPGDYVFSLSTSHECFEGMHTATYPEVWFKVVK